MRRVTTIGLVLVAIGLLGAQGDKKSASKAGDISFRVISKGKGLGASLQEDGTVTLSRLLEKSPRGVILNFVSLTCSFSKRQMPSVAQAVKEASSDGKTPLVVTVLIDKDAKRVREAARKQMTSTPVLWDRDRKAVTAYSVKLTPTVVVLDKDGKVLATYPGMIPPVEAGYTSFFASVLKASASGSALPPRPMFGMMGPTG
ncbi:MAG: TlpA family protein disulfide reductase [Armatimonadetes bacterium]|nr:TlpA family protein disulfide reductase [Armatimonadota bacterium]MDW8122804.1 TlpA disulfide reductase family protein [Armatimonadota bacterium]